jgi:uncharacterized protein (TIGR03437 family)
MLGRFRIPLRLLASLAFGTLAASAQNSILTCQSTVNPILVRGEGLTERMGDITLQCTGGVPNAPVIGNFSIFLSVPMTNRVDSSGYTDLSLTVDAGYGPLTANSKATYLNASTLSFSGVAFNLSPNGTVNLRLSNLRGAANQAGVNSARQITATISFTGGALISFSNNVFAVATVVRGLYSSYTSRLICGQGGTPSIDNPSLSSALANRAAYSTVRITEGFNNSLGPKSDFNFETADFGARIIVRYSGVPQGAHIFVPDGVVGYDGLQATSAGDYGLVPATGSYTPGTGTLLLIRIANADANGAGLASGPVIQPPTTISNFDSMSEVVIASDGTGQAVYEVFDANQFRVQSATIPSFIAIPAGLVQANTQITQDVYLGPISSSLATSGNPFITRYAPVAAPNDCSVFGDCGASYFPKLSVNTTSWTVSMTTLDAPKTQYFTLSNEGAGNFLWNASVQYVSGVTNGYQWLRLSPTSGINRETVAVVFAPGVLAPGVYDALINVDGGPIAGAKQIHVTLYYAFKAPTPVVINAVNAANLTPGILVPGSQAAILGDRLSGNKITVMFDNVPARVLGSVSANRLDVEIPYQLVGRQSSLIVVTIDGASSTPGLLIPIGDSAPGIYQNEIMNADNTFNSPSNGALAGSIIQVYATGLPVTGTYSGHIHDRTIDGDSLVYAGPAPTIIGVQLVQMVVPSDLPSITTGTAVCGGISADTQVCSENANLTIIAAPPPPPTDGEPVSRAVRRGRK